MSPSTDDAVEQDKSSLTVGSTMEPRELRGEEADQLIIQLLRDAGRPLTTREA